MAEGLTITASVTAVLQITNTVTSTCCDYGAAMSGASWQLSRIKTELESLRNVLQQLEPLAKQTELVQQTPDTKLPTFLELCGPEGLLAHYSHQVSHLEQ